MAMELGRTKDTGISFLVSAGIVYEIIAASCSSPQTAEINAGKRADTLMKWVHLGIIQSAVFVAAAAYFDSANRNAIIGGGAAAAAVMYAQYIHAMRAGLASDEPGTERY
jgi:ribose 5-phosphate isomerase RpiB